MVQEGPRYYLASQDQIDNIMEAKERFLQPGPIIFEEELQGGEEENE